MSRRTFDWQGYPCEPTNLSDDMWFYASKEGVIICGRSQSGDPCEQAIMPWRLVKRALNDHETSKERKR
jgi:hypothetical protein